MLDFHREAQDTQCEFVCTSLGIDVRIKLRSTGQRVATYYVLMGTTSVSTELDYVDEAWRRACRDHQVIAAERQRYVFELV